MKRSNLVINNVSCNVEKISKGKQTKKLFYVRSNVGDNVDRVQPFHISSKEKAYYTLKTRVGVYRDELEEMKKHFNLRGVFFNIPFNKISSNFVDLDRQDKVYASLEYDVEVIKQLGMVLNRLELDDLPFDNDDIAFARGLLIILNNITDCAEIVINCYLSNENLVQIKANKDEAKINKIYDHLEKFINQRKNCISDVKEQIKLLESRISRESLLLGIKEIVNCKGKVGRSVSLMDTLAITIWSLF
ncbi:hypothetical protein F9Y90_04505 (plasmid) [Borrelia miyamotoi]|uniref:Uncharacterized protein n=1 Tax=Borrelia miyamotoi TaxID=47466 RepID=A0AAX3JN91_9SPIR|nr:hypothetical protein [Borrelia miyamotoi]QFP42375.1 hypothetical protein F9Y90_04505 [Borrelia miyamotoi]QFP48496.1 hypothetical protein F9Y91_04490 [Borrelia miyamotoi]WAZ72397.1 hypothetical protein O5404_05085 [Borrelia miyamotoi]